MFAGQAQSLRKTFDRERSVSINVVVTRFAHFAGSRHQLFRRIEFAEQAIAHIGARNVHLCWSSCATSSRISAMEIAGNARTNRNRSVTNKPMVPANVL